MGTRDWQTTMARGSQASPQPKGEGFLAWLVVVVVAVVVVWWFA